MTYMRSLMMFRRDSLIPEAFGNKVFPLVAGIVLLASLSPGQVPSAYQAL